MELSVRLNDGLYNAGLLGFLRVMQEMDSDFAPISDTELKVDTACFENGKFTRAYFDVLINQYKDQIKYKALMDEITAHLNERSIPEEKDAEYKRFISSVKAKLDSASYKAAYEIIKQDEQEPFAMDALVQEWKAAKQPEKQKEVLARLKQRLEQYDRVFQLKDIAYNFVQPYWGGVSFLHKSKNKTAFEQSFEETFIAPILQYKPKKGKKVYRCMQCDAVLPGAANAAGLAWINDFGVDIKRKTNGFWNFHVDFAPCPLCSLIYACIPLGFDTMAYEGVFVNCNVSFDLLKGYNISKNITRQQGSFAAIINEFLAETNQKDAEKRLQNIQVIRRCRTEGGAWRYRVNILSAELLTSLKACKDELAFMAEKTPWLHRMVINELLDGKNLYPMLYKEYRKAMKDNRSLGIYERALKVQNTMFGKEIYMIKDKVEEARREGYFLQKEIESRVNDKKGITLSYGLLNALQTGDNDQFLQLIMRRYLSLGRAVPTFFIETIQNEEAFQAIGNAFLIGISQGQIKGNESKETEA